MTCRYQYTDALKTNENEILNTKFKKFTAFHFKINEFRSAKKSSFQKLSQLLILSVTFLKLGVFYAQASTGPSKISSKYKTAPP